MELFKLHVVHTRLVTLSIRLMLFTIFTKTGEHCLGETFIFQLFDTFTKKKKVKECLFFLG